MLKDEVANIAVISKFEYILAEVVHSLKIAVVRMIERKGF